MATPLDRAPSTRRRRVLIDPLEQRAMFSGTLAPIATTNGQPQPQVAVDAAGDVFGTTAATAASAGTVFEIAAGTSTPVTLAAFGPATGYNADGIDPANIVIDSAGDLFGTSGPTVTGTVGTPGTDDTLWEVKAGSATVTPLATFGDTGTSGVSASPATALAVDAAGDLFVDFSGTYADGDFPTALKYSGGTFTSVVDATGSAHYPHYAPQAPLAVDPAGDAFAGFLNPTVDNQIELYRIAATRTSTFLDALPSTEGSASLTGLAADASGDLFATGLDAVTEVTAAGTYSRVALNGTTDGTGFVGNPVADARGDLFAVTTGGGANGDGTVVELPVGATAVTVLSSLTAVPTAAGLTADAAGDVYGTLTSATAATVFEVPAAAVVPGPGPASTVLPQVTTPGLLPAVARTTVPASAVGGYTKGTVQLKLTNTTTATDRGVNKVTVLLVPAGVTSRAGAVGIKTVARRLSLAANGSTVMTLPVQIPGGMAAGTYTMAFEATDAAGNLTRINGPTIAVAKPAVSLTSVVSAKQVGTKTVLLTATVTFAGNVDAAGQLAIDLGLMTAATADGPTTTIPAATLPVGTVVRRVTTRAGRSVTIQLRVDPAYDTYMPTVTVSFMPNSPSTSEVAVSSTTATGTAIAFFPPAMAV